MKIVGPHPWGPGTPRSSALRNPLPEEPLRWGGAQGGSGSNRPNWIPNRRDPGFSLRRAILQSTFLDPSGADTYASSSVSQPCFVFWNKAHAQHVLAGRTNIHGKEVVDSLRAETFGVELSMRGTMARNRGVIFSIVACPPRTIGTGLDVALDGKMSTETTECGFDFIEQLMRDTVRARCPPHLDLGGLELKVN